VVTEMIQTAGEAGSWMANWIMWRHCQRRLYP